jgi:hypothetical protein
LGRKRAAMAVELLTRWTNWTAVALLHRSHRTRNIDQSSGSIGSHSEYIALLPSVQLFAIQGTASLLQQVGRTEPPLRR